jgi:threonine dehydrogenase-like Zn-dependent dehydrogenase
VQVAGGRALRRAVARAVPPVPARALRLVTRATATMDGEAAVQAAATAADRPLKVLVAGGGIGGLMLARSLQKKGMDVQVGGWGKQVSWDRLALQSAFGTDHALSTRTAFARGEHWRGWFCVVSPGSNSRGASTLEEEERVGLLS